MVWLLLCAGLRLSLLLGRTAREIPTLPPPHHGRGVRLRGTVETAVSSHGTGSWPSNVTSVRKATTNTTCLLGIGNWEYE